MAFNGIIIGVIVVSLAFYLGALLSSGPVCPLSCAILPTFISEAYHLCPKPHIEGWTDERFVPVKEAFQQNFEEYLEVGSQLTMYHKGRKVVDLWGKTPELAPSYSNHSLQRVFSSGKMVEVLAVVICVEKGLFLLDDPIASHWPEFAKNGKGEITIAQLMRHESGLSKLSAHVTLLEIDPYTRGNPAPLARIIEDSHPIWPNNTRRVYHAMSRGWILAELIRRVDPAHRLFHEFVREEIAEVLGIDVFFLPQGRAADIVPLQKISTSWFTANVLVPYFLDGFPLVPSISEEIKNMISISLAKDSFLVNSMGFKHSTLDLGDPTNYNQFYNYSIGSSFGCVSSGPALAVVAAVFEGKGLFAPSGVRLFKETTWKLGSTCGEEVPDAGLAVATRFTDFGYGCFPDGWFGWGGWGGSQVRWREEGVALGYAMTRMGYHLISDPRTVNIYEAVNASLNKLNH